MVDLSLFCFAIVWHDVSNNGTAQILQPQNSLCWFANNGPEKLHFILLSYFFPLICHIKGIAVMLAIKSRISSVLKQRTYVAKVIGFISREILF